MSNIERRLKNEEVGKRYEVRGTKYGNKEMLKNYFTELARFISIVFRLYFISKQIEISYQSGHSEKNLGFP